MRPDQIGPWNDPWAFTDPMSFAADMRFREFELTPERMFARMPISRQILDDPSIREQYRTQIIDDAVDRAVLHCERAVYTGVLPNGTETRTEEVTVPYQATVSVDLPRPWWRRLLRLPARVIRRDVGGTVRATVHVKVDYAQRWRFPEFRGVGPGVPTGQATAHVRPVRIALTETFPMYGAHAAVASTRLRCTAPACGHHVAAHVPADEIESGGCTIDDCRCERTYP